jgi:hypothetical protein
MKTDCEHSFTQFQDKKDNITYFYNFCVYCKIQVLIGYYVDMSNESGFKDCNIYGCKL